MNQYTHNPHETETVSHYFIVRRKELLDQHWSRGKSRQIAESEGISLDKDHWDVIVYLRKHYLAQGLPRHARYLANDLRQQFKTQGGDKYLRQLFPDGPVTQGSRIANLPTPAGASDTSFGCNY